MNVALNFLVDVYSYVAHTGQKRPSGIWQLKNVIELKTTQTKVRFETAFISIISSI